MKNKPPELKFINHFYNLINIEIMMENALIDYTDYLVETMDLKNPLKEILQECDPHEIVQCYSEIQAFPHYLALYKAAEQSSDNVCDVEGKMMKMNGIPTKLKNAIESASVRLMQLRCEEILDV